MRITIVASLFLTTWPVMAAQGGPDCAAVLAHSASFPLAHPYVGHLVAEQKVTPGNPVTDHLCYGTLVSPKGHVLTAAHCVFANEYNINSPYLAGLHLCMGDKGDLPLQIVSVNSYLDYAILQAPNASDADRQTLARYGWAAFAGGLPRAGLTVFRAGHGNTCATRDGTDDFHLHLDCSGIQGDSGETVLSGNQVVGIITDVSTGDSFGTSSYLLFPREAPVLGAPFVGGLFVDDHLTPRTVVIGSPADIDIVAGYRPETRNVNLVTYSPAFDENHCQTIPPPGMVSQDRRKICTVSPQGSFDVQYRASVDWGDSNHQVNAPWDSSERDAGGMPVETVQVLAVEPTDRVWTGAANPNVTLNTDPDPGQPQYFYYAGLTGIYRIDKPEQQPERQILRGGYFIYSGRTTPIQPALNAWISNLACDSTYHYQAVAQVDTYPNDGTVTELKGQDRTFRTLPCIPTSITGGKLGVYKICRNSITLESEGVSCRPPGPCSPLSWLITYSYQSAITISATTFGIPGNAPKFELAGLHCGTTYHLAAKAVTYYGTVPIEMAVPDLPTASCFSRPSVACPGDSPFPF